MLYFIVLDCLFGTSVEDYTMFLTSSVLLTTLGVRDSRKVWDGLLLLESSVVHLLLCLFSISYIGSPLLVGFPLTAD